MRKRYSFKKFIAVLTAVLSTAGVTGNSLNYTPAGAEENEYAAETQITQAETQAPEQSQDTTVFTEPTMEIPDSVPDMTDSGNGTDSTQQTQDVQSAESDYQQESATESVGENSSSENTQQTDDSGADSSQSSSSGADMTQYAQKLRELAKQQEELDKELSETQKKLKSQTEKNKTLKKKIDSVNEEITVLNGYMTALEISINSNKRKIDTKKQEIEDGVDEFKQRIRAMYLSGSDSYATMILESNSFYDALMRMELIKRVADHDNSMIDNLVKLKKQYEETEKKLEEQQKEYEKQSEQLAKKKKNLDELYETNEETRKELAKKKKALEAQNKSYQQQASQYGSSLADVLKSSGNTPQDQQVQATMALADAKLAQLRKDIAARKKSGEKIDKYECQYTFAWPIPQSYNITYGIGARWGAYHAGLDIGGEHGYKVTASEAGTVLRVNTICPHDYGKNGSCGCGGGYGKYVIIDHGNDFITLYGHLCEVDVSVGDKVKEGEVIGKMGSTGFSTGNHTHFELRYQGYITNPALYVDIK